MKVEIRQFGRQPLGTGKETVNYFENEIGVPVVAAFSTRGRLVLDYSVKDWGIKKIHFAIFPISQAIGFEADPEDGAGILRKKTASNNSQDLIYYRWLGKKEKADENSRWIPYKGQAYSVGSVYWKKTYGPADYPHFQTHYDKFKPPMTLILVSGNRSLQLSFQK